MKTQKIRNLWPNWKPTDDEIALWEKRLRFYPDEVVDLAAEYYKTTKDGSYKTPKIYDIIKICKERNVKEASDDKDVICIYAFRCISHDIEKYIGREDKYFGFKEDLKRSQFQLENNAREDLERHKRIYRGDWAIVWKVRGVA